MTSPPPAARRCVLDTQSVLDWLHFADPVCAEWETWRQAGAWTWVASPALRAELAHVLGRDHLPAARHLGADALLAEMDARVLWLDGPAETTPGLRCKDRDDQKFIELARHTGCTWLVSRDKAVLKLARKLRALSGCLVVAPRHWCPAQK